MSGQISEALARLLHFSFQPSGPVSTGIASSVVYIILGSTILFSVLKYSNESKDGVKTSGLPDG